MNAHLENYQSNSLTCYTDVDIRNIQNYSLTSYSQKSVPTKSNGQSPIPKKSKLRPHIFQNLLDMKYQQTSFAFVVIRIKHFFIHLSIDNYHSMC